MKALSVHWLEDLKKTTKLKLVQSVFPRQFEFCACCAVLGKLLCCVVLTTGKVTLSV